MSVDCHSAEVLYIQRVKNALLKYTTGYSYLTNQYGLTVDTVQAYELVMPNGTVKTVNKEDEDLFFGLKVGVCLFIPIVI